MSVDVILRGMVMEISIYDYDLFVFLGIEFLDYGLISI